MSHSLLVQAELIPL